MLVPGHSLPVEIHCALLFPARQYFNTPSAGTHLEGCEGHRGSREISPERAERDTGIDLGCIYPGTYLRPFNLHRQADGKCETFQLLR